MDRFLIIAPHTAGDCVKALRQVEATGYITHFDWGCKDGDHTGWAVVEAENATQALMSVPTFNRPDAKAVKLTKFTPDEVRSMHS